MQNKPIKRFIAMFILLCTIVTFITSTVYIAHHANHDCVGEHCSVCVQLHNCADNLIKLGRGLTFSATLFISFIYLYCLLVLAGIYLDKGNTLFAQKIRLDI